MDKKKESQDKKLEFNTYCIFTEEKKNVEDTIGLVFKDYLDNVKSRKT